MKIVSKILLFLFLLTVPFLTIGFGRAILPSIKKISMGSSRWSVFLFGVLIFFPCLFAAKRIFPSGWNYLETLEHELTHLLIGLLFLKIPVGFRVSAHAGGEVRQIGFVATGQIWVTLAPYFFPTVSLLVVIISYFAGFNNLTLLGILGFTTAFHLVSNWGETSFRQPDLQKAGILKTILILPVMNLICYGAVLAFVSGGKSGFINFWSEGFRSSIDILQEFIRFVFN